MMLYISIQDAIVFDYVNFKRNVIKLTSNDILTCHETSFLMFDKQAV